MDDSEIIELFWQRSDEAIRAVAEKYGALCRGITNNLLRSVEDSQECVNDVWHSLWNAIPPERPKNLTAYIARVARNLAMKRLTYRTAAKRQAAFVSFEELDHCVSHPVTVEAVLEGKVLSQALDAFLDRLKPEDRNLFLRRYWFFDSTKVLADSFRMSESNVKIRLHRIRKKLKDYLEKEADIYVG